MDLISPSIVFSFFHLLLLLLLLRAATVASIGINYGQIGNNLPSPEDVVPLVKSIGGTKVRLYDANERVLRAFANTGVEFTVGLGNEYLARMCDPDTAEQWIKSNVQAHLPATNITCIAVGNEVLTFNDETLSDNLLPAMQGLHTALVTLGLHKQVTVTTAHSLAILQTSYPPSAGSFRHDLSTYVSDIVDFHARTNSPFLINAYPFFAYKANPKQVSLDYVLFQSTTGVVDPATGLRYDNMLFAQIDSVYAALASLGYKNLSVHISETGWPSKGDPDEFGATPDNARRYNGNLMKVVAQNKGTPMNPDNDLNIYLFALFNENMKPGPTSERNYGLFKPDRTPVYALPITKNDGVSYNASVGGNVATPAPTSSPTPPDQTSSSTAYLSFSSSSRMVHYGVCTLFIPWVASMMLLFVY